MSYYYNYSIGYITEDNKIYPVGVYDCFGKMHDALTRSRSFASDLHEDFYPVKDEQVTDELRKEFEYEDWQGQKNVDVKWLLVSELPSGSFIKTGYFLLSDIRDYESTHDTFDLFYDQLTPHEYAIKLEDELKFGPPKPYKDIEGEEITPHSVRDYGYYAYPDYLSKEYEASIIRTVADIYAFCIPKGARLVVLETEG